MTRAEIIKYIHVLKRDLSLSDETYRTALRAVTGHESCKDLSQEELNLFYLALQKMKDNRGSAGKVVTNGQQQRMIAKLGYILKWDWKSIAKFVERTINKKSTRGCSAAELSKVILGMIGVIDYKISKGEITLSHTERLDYLSHTHAIRKTPLA